MEGPVHASSLEETEQVVQPTVSESGSHDPNLNHPLNDEALSPQLAVGDTTQAQAPIPLNSNPSDPPSVNEYSRDAHSRSHYSIAPLAPAIQLPDAAGGFGSTDSNDPDSTPRSEVPSTHPASEVAGAVPDQGASLSTDGYFDGHSQRPLQLHSHPNDPVNIHLHSDVSGQSPHLAPIAESSLSRESTQTLTRPPAVRDSSSTSTSSTTSGSTVRATRFLPLGTLADVPTYPNQAHSALHAQMHPTRTLRSRSSNPAPSLTYRAHSSMDSVSNPDLSPPPPEQGSRTAGNSPASTPGLFTPTTSPSRQHSQDEESGSYSSPYLHWSHRQVPKETHRAEVDFDPISGRKVINQYEIIDELGRGVHGKVKLGRNLQSGDFVAIKIVERFSRRPRLGKSGNHEAKIKREIAILKKARHPNIVSLLEVVDDPARKKVYIVLEHVEMGEVRWRTDAAVEIAIVEWRRFQRESSGVFDNDAALLEDEQILQEARRERELKEKNRSRESKKRRAVGAAGDFWSHEYGGETDEDEEGLSRTSTKSDLARHQDFWHPPLALQPVHSDPALETAIHDPNHLLHEPYVLDPLSREMRNDRGSASDNTGFEKSTFGAFDFDMIRGRNPSVVGSASSHSLHDEEGQVPEHFRYVPVMTLAGARSAIRDTILGLEFLHYQGAIHRDIKPANLLQAADHHIKISDFGVSYLGRQRSDDDQSESDIPDEEEAIELAKTVGTPAFYAPELCRSEDADDKGPWRVSNQIDIWALGVTLYCLVYGRVPFHANDTYALMRCIAEEEVYIPRRRLKAVDEHAGSRSSSQNTFFRSNSGHKRLPHDLDYEDIDDDLYDLIRRLLIKDPSKRIKLAEVKHHPWILHGVHNPSDWIEATDPSRQTEGKKIQVSKEDVDAAVGPLNIVDRIRFFGRRVVDSLSISRNGSRRRAHSNATAGDKTTRSNASSSSNISGDAGYTGRQRPSLKPDDIRQALQRGRETDHPLSHSVTASPEGSDHHSYFPRETSRPPSPGTISNVSEDLHEQRPAIPQRMRSTMSATGSIRTIRPADVVSQMVHNGASTLSALPSTPLALDMEHNPSLTGVTGGAKDRIMRTVRSRERNASSASSTHNRALSIDSRSEDGQGEPTLAISDTNAAGHVHTPDLLRRASVSGSSAAPSPSVSRAASVSHPISYRGRNRRVPSDSSLSRQSSLGSMPSLASADLGTQGSPRSPFLPLLGPPSEDRHYRPPPPTTEPSTADANYLQAQEGLIRRRRLENDIRRTQEAEKLARPMAAANCPPSPDDHPTEPAPEQPADILEGSSSEERVASTPSFGSMPSSVSPGFDLEDRDEGLFLGERKRGHASERGSIVDSDDSDEDDDDEEDGGLVMARHRSVAR